MRGESARTVRLVDVTLLGALGGMGDFVRGESEVSKVNVE